MENTAKRNVAFLSVTCVVAVGVIAAFSLGVSAPDVASKSSAAVMGHVTLTVTDDQGNIKAYRQSDNAIVHGGLQALISNAVSDIVDTSRQFEWLSIGTSDTAAAAADSALVAESTCSRSPGTFTASAPSGGISTLSVTAEFSGSGGCTGTGIVEAGIFDTSDLGAGTMLARNTFSSVNLGSSDTLTINWDLVFSDT